MRNLSRPIVGALGLAKVAPALCRFKPLQAWRMPAEAVAAEAGGADLPRVTRVTPSARPARCRLGSIPRLCPRWRSVWCQRRFRQELHPEAARDRRTRVQGLGRTDVRRFPGCRTHPDSRR